jgi:signal recognition particle receptor subunit beta
MATIDAAQNVLVVRIVYDGPAFSGKTTSLKSLAEGVSTTLEIPEERDGRTLYFDWMEYVGGLYEGRQIRCQIISVPGQRELAHRRALLLQSADAVVCVLDTRKAELDFGLEWLRELSQHCRGESPPVGIVLQANKRDASDAVPREELRLQVTRVAPIAIVESVATVADGIREAFVLAVRLALDRVRALSQEGRLGEQVGERDAAGLMERLREAESDRSSTVVELSPVLHTSLPKQPFRRSSRPPPMANSSAPITQRPGPVAEDGDEQLFVPDPMMPGGMIWPPVDGRALLHEVASLRIRPARTASGSWSGSGAGWRFHSASRAIYDDPNRAREELIGWARMHSSNAAQLSAGRAVIMAEAGGGRLRLWQLVRVESVLRERLDAALVASTVEEVVDGVLEVATQLLNAREWFSSGTVPLPCTLWTVGGVSSPRPKFVSLMPALGSSLPAQLDERRLLERELLLHVRSLRRGRVDFSEMQRQLLARAELAAAGSPARLLAEVVRLID